MLCEVPSYDVNMYNIDVSNNLWQYSLNVLRRMVLAIEAIQYLNPVSLLTILEIVG